MNWVWAAILAVLGLVILWAAIGYCLHLFQKYIEKDL